MVSGKSDLKWWTGNRLVAASLSRLLFFPAFLLCNVDGSVLPVMLKSDFFPIAIMVRSAEARVA